MAEQGTARTSKQQRSIPVKVSVDHRPAPTSLPPIEPRAPQSQPPKRKAAPKLLRTNPVKGVKQPVHEWSEARRRRLMWWLVGGGATVIIIGWLAVVRIEMNGGSGKNLFSEAWHLISSINLSGTKKSTAAEKEIRQLDQQVFPQFSQ